MYDNPFTNPTDICNKTAHRTSAKPIDPRRNLDRPPPAGNAFDICHA
jgi:hypothetical protein